MLYQGLWESSFFPCSLHTSISPFYPSILFLSSLLVLCYHLSIFPVCFFTYRLTLVYVAGEKRDKVLRSIECQMLIDWRAKSRRQVCSWQMYTEMWVKPALQSQDFKICARAGKQALSVDLLSFVSYLCYIIFNVQWLKLTFYYTLNKSFKIIQMVLAVTALPS